MNPATTTRNETIAFRCTTASVRLHTNIPGVLGEARKILYSYQEVPDPDPDSGWHVHLTYDPDVAADPAATTAGAVAFDIGPDTDAYRHGGPSGTTFWVPARSTLLHADPAANVIRARCSSVRAALDWAPRLIRQAMTSQLLAAGMVYAHAAAFTRGDHGVLIAGNRGKGKTTTLLASLQHLGGHYSTNDRLLLHPTGGQLHGYPWPMPLRAGIGTLTALPHLQDLVPAHQRALPAPQRWTFKTKIVVEPPAFSRLMQPDGRIAADLNVTLMIWPHLDPDRTTVDVQQVDPAEVTDTLTTTGMFMHDLHHGTSAHTNQWLAPPPDPETAHRNLQHAAAALAAKPCYRVHAGSDPAALAAAVGRLLDREMPR